MTSTLSPVVVPTSGQPAQASPALPVGTIQIRYGPLSRMLRYRLANAEWGMAIDTDSANQDVYVFLGSPKGNVQICPVDVSGLQNTLASLQNTISGLQAQVLTLENSLMSYSAKAQLNWRGTWAAPTVYGLNDETYYQGSSVVSLQAGNTGNVPPVYPAAATAFWGYVSQQGQTGSAGAAGASAASGINVRSFNQSMNPIPAPPAGTTLDEITYDLSAGGTLTATLYPKQAGLDTRIKTEGSGQLVLSPPSGLTIDGAATFTLNGATKDAFTFTANAVTSTDEEVL